jgi:hypothetical protein
MKKVVKTTTLTGIYVAMKMECFAMVAMLNNRKSLHFPNVEIEAAGAIHQNSFMYLMSFYK